MPLHKVSYRAISVGTCGPNFVQKSERMHGMRIISICTSFAQISGSATGSDRPRVSQTTPVSLVQPCKIQKQRNMPETQVEVPVARPFLLSPALETARCLSVKGAEAFQALSFR
jgi:hypothetical protein